WPLTWRPQLPPPAGAGRSPPGRSSRYWPPAAAGTAGSHRSRRPAAGRARHSPSAGPRKGWSVGPSPSPHARRDVLVDADDVLSHRVGASELDHSLPSMTELHPAQPGQVVAEVAERAVLRHHRPGARAVVTEPQRPALAIGMRVGLKDEPGGAQQT